MLVVLHGLSGGSHEIYLRAVLEPLVDAGWEACVVNSRGCAMSKITTAVLYNARATWDLRQVVKWCRQRWPKRRLYGIGFSLGANIMVNVRRPQHFVFLVWIAECRLLIVIMVCSILARKGRDACLKPRLFAVTRGI